jgi:hypothetical protein
MEFIKKNYLIIIFAVLIIVIIGLTVKVINCNPVSIAPPNREREYLLHKIEQDSLMLIDITANYIYFKELAESKPKEIIIIKTKYVKIKDSLTTIPIDGKVSALAKYLHNQ